MALSDTPAPARLRPVHRTVRLVTLRVVAALMLREMATTYGRSPGGYAWAVLEPVGSILVLTAIFSLNFRHPALGTDFAMFYATGMLPFAVFSQISQKVSQALRFSRQLLAFPRVTILDALIARFLLTLLLQLLVAYIVIGGIRVWNDTGTALDLPRILMGFAMAAALGLGTGTLNCVIMTAFPLYQTVWSIATRPLVLLSGVIFMLESVPRPWRDYLEWNPLAHAVAEVRAGFYFGYHPDYVAPDYVFLIALATFALGLLLVWRFHREALEG